jgi:nitrite reductase (NADH) large subunit
MEKHPKIRKRLVIIGNGMTGFKFCQKLAEQSLQAEYEIVVFGEEPYAAYDRVHLTSFYTGSPIEALTLATKEWYADNGIELYTQSRVEAVDPQNKQLSLQNEKVVAYDVLVFATGSSAFVPPVEGVGLQGVFVYRTLEDIAKIKAQVKHSKTGAVIGGGLLGLEAAKALLDDGIETSVIEMMPWLMGRQLDEAGGAVLKSKLEKEKLTVLTKTATSHFAGKDKVEKIVFADGSELPVDIVVISAGIKPRDELALKAGIEVGQRGGIVVNQQMQTSHPDVYAIGECALANGMIWGLVAPCYQMAEILVENLAGGSALFEGADLSTKLKLIGTDVASFGDSTGLTEGSVPLVMNNPFAGHYKRLNLSADGQYLIGGIMVGDAGDYNMLHQAYKSKIKLPANPESLFFTGNGGSGFKLGVLDLPDEAVICSCENITKGKILGHIASDALTTVAEIKKCCKAGTGCGGCVPMLDDMLTAYFKSQGKEVKKVVCEHFNYSRQELYDLIKIEKIKTYNELIGRFGKGYGCEICKPVVASLLASIWNDTIVKQDTIQDTNDRFLANIQKGGSYSVVPRVPGGEITPEKLQVIGHVAEKYKLYTKITGGQRIDMFGASVDQLPEIWKELLDAGFESGHAYGKALRTVKSCVGSTWCRFGLHDSVSFAIEIENRYKGLRAPHKIKGGVSGCIRECAEARGKDFGIIATEKGWNLFVCGNGGANPVHAVLFASDLDSETCIKYLDRFLMFYIKTAAPLTRTSKWLAGLDGGIEYLKEVVINDSLGLAEQFETEMGNLIENYKCEWRQVVENPELRSKFKSFVNSPEPDTSIRFVPVREQKKPAEWSK